MPVRIILPTRTLGLLVFLTAIVTAGSLAFVYLPKATIIVYPTTQTRSVEQTIVLSSETATPDFVRFILPARIIEKTVEDREVITRPEESVREDYARGVVTFFNKEPTEQRLLPQTHLRHEETGVFFLTDTPVNIPANGTVQIAVTAKETGSAGNVEPGKFIVDRLPEHAQSIIYAESSSAFHGGSASDTPLTQQELDSVKKSLLERSKNRVIGELTLEAGGAPIRDDLITIETVEEDVSAEVGSEAAEITVRIKLQARGFIVDENDLLSLTLLALRQDHSADEEFLSYDPASFAIDIGSPDFSRGEVRVTSSLRGTFASSIAPSVLNKDNLAGLSQPEVIRHFEDFPSVGEVEVVFSPFWVTSVPSRIHSVNISARKP